MTLLRALLRVVRLPVDFLFLTVDFCRLMLWLVCRRARTLVGWPPRHWGPYCQSARTVSTGDQICPAARKYGTLRVFRLLCPYVRLTKERERFCTFADAVGGDYCLAWARSLGLGAALVALWIGVGVAAVHLPRPRPLSPRLLMRLWEPRDAPLDRVAPEPERVPQTARDKSHTQATDVAPVRRRKGPAPEPSQDAKPRSASPGTPDHEATHGTSAKAEEFVNSGDVYFAQERYPEAIIEYKNAIQQDRSNPRARLGLGLSYLRSRRVREARDELRVAVRLDPTLAEAHAQLCRAELARQDATTASEHATKLKELKPDDPEGYVLLSACLEAQDDWEGAEKEMRAATQLGGATADTFFRAGSLYWRRDDLKSAEAAYRAALEIDDTHVDARIGLAGVLRTKRELDAARQELDAAHQRDPDHPGAAIELAEWHAAKGQVKEAIATYEQLAKAQPKLYEARARLAWLLVRSGRANDGVAAANALVKEARGHVLGHFVLAETFHTKRLYDMAMDHCEQALATNRAHLPTRVLLARCYQAKQQHEDAVRQLERVLRASPKHSRARLLLAKSYLNLKQHDKAKECYEQVAKDNPTSAMPHLGLAQVHAARGLPEAAVLCYEEALKRAPGDPVATNNLATTLLELGRDLDRAHELAAEQRKRFPASPILADTYGWICYHRGEYQKAINALAFATERWPRVADTRYHHGMALYKAGKVEKARAELAAALELSQEFEGAAEARQVLAEMGKESGED